MKYTKKEEKQAIRNAFNAFLASKGLKFKPFCIVNGLDYNLCWSWLNVGNIEEDNVNFLISKISKNHKLEKLNKEFIITNRKW